MSIASSRRRRRVPTRILMVAAALGVAAGLVSVPLLYANIAAGALGPVGLLAFVGVYAFPAALGAAVLRRPGAGLLVTVMAGLVQAPLSPYGWQMLISSLEWGVPVELVFLATRYRSSSPVVPVAACTLACTATSVIAWFLFSLGRLAVPVQVVAMAVQPVSGFVAGVLTALLAHRLVRAGVASWARPVRTTAVAAAGERDGGS